MFKIVYKKGSQNVVADALSRINYEPMELQSIIGESKTANITAITRSKARAVEESLSTPKDISIRKNSHNFYEIEENNDILTNPNNIDHIFYLFSSRNCEMKRKCQYRMKANIDLPVNLLPCIPYKLTPSQTIFLFPNEIISDKRIANIKMTLNVISQICIDNNYNDIAFNIDMKEAKAYFEFKYLFEEIFKNSQIKTTFYLNKIIDLVEMDQILDILSTYHNSSLAGHASFEKTKNSIKRYYNWPTINADIKRFVKNCEICKKAKISRHTQSPMQITSTSQYPFQKANIDFVNAEREHINEFPCIFTCLDELTKYAIAVRARNCTALTGAKKFV